MTKINKTKTLILSFLMGLLFFGAMQPFWIWHVSEYLKLLLLVLPIVPIIFNMNIKGKQSFPFFVFLGILFFNVLTHGYSFLFSIYMLVFVFIPFCQDEVGIKAYNVFRKIMALCFVVSLVQWFLFWMGFNMPSLTVEPLNDLKKYNYHAYLPCLVVPNTFFHFRFESAFDEPGVVGTISLLILFVENYNLKNFYNIIILIAGLCSLSMFFIGGTMIFYLIKYGIKKPLYLLAFLICLSSFYLVTKDNPVLDELVYARFEYDEATGGLAGLNRSTLDLDKYFESILGTSTFYFGVDNDTREEFASSYGYKTVILRFGFIVCLLYVMFFLMYARRRGLKGLNYIMFCTMFLMTLYQRPNLFDVVYVFIFSQFININLRSKKTVLTKK